MDTSPRQGTYLMQEIDVDARALLESAPDGILLADASGRIRLLNRQIESLFGYQEDELVGQPVEVLMPERYRNRHTGHRDSYSGEPRVRPMGLGMELIGLRKDGSEFPVEISLSPMLTSSGPVITAVIRDVSERRKLQAERNALEIELETERERYRIGMDLHDGIMQSIYAVALRLELALDLGGDRAQVNRHLEQAIEDLHDVTRDIRSYIFDLRPRQFKGSLSAALLELADEFQQNSQIETKVEVSPQPELQSLDQAQSVSLYLIAHEALSNVRKHADASRVSISLRHGARQTELCIIDDGKGFNAASEIPEKHRGLRNMTARARAAGATMKVESSPGAGTRVELAIPH
jgi:PAS domain S-box-containing protein